MVNFGVVAATRRPRRPLRGYRNVLFGNKVDLGFYAVLLPPGPRQDSGGILDHFRMAAGIDRSGLGRETPKARVFANEVVDAAHFPGPSRIFPRTADGGNVFQPGNFRGDALELVDISKLRGAAGAFQQEEHVAAGRFALPALGRERADVADERS